MYPRTTFTFYATCSTRTTATVHKLRRKQSPQGLVSRDSNQFRSTVTNTLQQDGHPLVGQGATTVPGCSGPVRRQALVLANYSSAPNNDRQQQTLLKHQQPPPHTAGYRHTQDTRATNTRTHAHAPVQAMPHALVPSTMVPSPRPHDHHTPLECAAAPACPLWACAAEGRTSWAPAFASAGCGVAAAWSCSPWAGT